MSPQHKSYGVPGACAAREPRTELLKQRAPGHSSVPCWAILRHGPANAWTPSTQHVDGGPGGCSPSLPNTPKHLYLVFLQRGVLQEHPRLAPVPKEPMWGERERERCSPIAHLRAEPLTPAAVCLYTGYHGIQPLTLLGPLPIPSPRPSPVQPHWGHILASAPQERGTRGQ